MWAPAVSDVVVNVASSTPLTTATVTGEPTGFPSTVNCTVPVGAAATPAAGLMTAVKVTLWPTLAEAVLVVRVVLVVTGVAFWV